MNHTKDCCLTSLLKTQQIQTLINNFFRYSVQTCIDNNTNNKKIHNAHIVMNHESEARAGRSMLIVNELGYEVRLEVALETV